MHAIHCQSTLFRHARLQSVVFEHLKLSVSDLSIGMQADLACRYGAARKRCPISSSGDARKASDVGSPGSTDMPEATHPSDEAAKAFRSFRRLRMASATGSPASSEMTQGSNLAGSRAPRAPEDVPMAKGLCSLGRPDIDKGLDSIPAVRVPEASQKAYLATDTSKPSIPEVPGSSVPHGNARGSEAMPPAMPFMKVGARPTLTVPANVERISG